MNTTTANAVTRLPVAALEAPLAPVDPQELQRQVDSATASLRLAATPQTTWIAYAKGLRYLGAWAQLRFGQPLALPVPVAHVQLFIIDHFGVPERVPCGDGHSRLALHDGLPPAIDQAMVAAGFKADLGRHSMNTIDQRLAILSWAHKEHRLDSPCRDPVIRQMLSDCRKLALEAGEGPKSKSAATLNVLDAMLATCDDSLEGIRDRALLLFGWASGGRRRSEIARAEVGDLEWFGPDKAVFRMRRSKTGDTGPKPVLDETATALRQWLEMAQVAEGPIFRRLWNKTVGNPLSPHAIAAIVQRRAKLAGLPGDFAGHSLRRGFVTEATSQAIPLPDTMALTGHRLVKSVIRYADVGSVLTSKAASLSSRRKP